MASGVGLLVYTSLLLHLAYSILQQKTTSVVQSLDQRLARIEDRFREMNDVSSKLTNCLQQIQGLAEHTGTMHTELLETLHMLEPLARMLPATIETVVIEATHMPKTFELTLCTGKSLKNLGDQKKVKVTMVAQEDLGPGNQAPQVTQPNNPTDAQPSNTDSGQPSTADRAQPSTADSVQSRMADSVVSTCESTNSVTTGRESDINQESHDQYQDPRHRESEGVGQILRALGVGNAAKVKYVVNLRTNGDQ